MSYWYWLIIGVVLVAAEIAVPSFVIIWFGIAAILTGIASFWITGLGGQLGVYALLSVLCFCAGWFGIVRRLKQHSTIGQSKESVIGETGIVAKIDRCDFVAGRVRFMLPVLGADEWPFISGDPLTVGDRVVIVDVVGSKLKVKKG